MIIIDEHDHMTEECFDEMIREHVKKTKAQMKVKFEHGFETIGGRVFWRNIDEHTTVRVRPFRDPLRSAKAPPVPEGADNIIASLLGGNTLWVHLMTKQQYRQTLKQIHPDVCKHPKAKEATQILTRLYN